MRSPRPTALTVRTASWRLALAMTFAAVGLAPPALASDLALDGETALVRGIGEDVAFSVTGAPGSDVWLLLDLDPGPVSLFGQTVEVGFSPAFTITAIGALSGGGALAGLATIPDETSFHGLTIHLVAAVLDAGAPGGYDFSNGASLTVVDRGLELAGNPLTQYPGFETVRAFNQGATVHLAVDPGRYPLLVGRSGDAYVVAAKTAAEWDADPTLVDLTGDGVEAVSFVAGTIQANTFLVDSGTLNGTSGLDVGVGYDLVVDLDGNGLYDGADLLDGYGDEAGLYVVRDTTLPGPLAVTEALYSGGSFLSQNLFYPTDIASMGELPLVVVSHGNGHVYTWYDHIGTHLASYGFIVMSHQNNTVPGVESASTTTLTNTDWFLGNLDIIEGGALVGHVDVHDMTWIGHSRGGEGVVRAYDRIVDGTWVPAEYTQSDVKLISSIAPTNFLGPSSANPHAVDYHLWTGGADADVDGCADTDIVQTFQLHDRAEQERLSISLHGVGHGDFHNSTGSVASGPCLVGKTDTHAIVRGYLLPLVKHQIQGDVPAKDFLWRQWERFAPIGKPTAGCVVVDLMYRDGAATGKFVIDDFQTNADTGTSSSGGAVNVLVAAPLEGRPDDANTNFTHGLDVWNGFTGASTTDAARALVFEYSGGGGGGGINYDVVPAARDMTGYEYLSFRACQQTRHPFTTAELRDLTFTVMLVDGGGAFSFMNISAYGGGIEEPYQRTSCGTGAGWANEYETIRLRLTDFQNNGTGLDLRDVRTIAFQFGVPFGSATGRLGFDDLELTTD